MFALHDGVCVCACVRSRELVAKEGYAALFKGLGPAMVRAFPANAACFMGVEVSMKVMNALW